MTDHEYDPRYPKRGGVFSRTTYAELYAACSSSYGDAPPPQEPFVIPDFRGRLPDDYRRTDR